MQHKKVFSLIVALMSALLPVAMPMGETAQESLRKEPAFAPLHEGEECYDGIVKDETVETRVTQLSFFGHSTLGGIRNDSDDSVTKLDLTNIKSIKIKEASTISKRYPEKDFALIQKVSKTGIVTDDLLLPRHVIVCGIDKATGDEKSWYLNKIDELIVEETTQIPQPVTKETRSVAKGKRQVLVTTESEQKPKVVEKPIAVTEKYVEKEVVIREKQATSGPQTIKQSAINLVNAIVDLVKSLFTFIKGLFV